MKNLIRYSAYFVKELKVIDNVRIVDNHKRIYFVNYKSFVCWVFKRELKITV